MFRPLVRSHHRPPRRGTAILITCFFLITIMMVTGLALVMYAAREKAAALAYQEAGAGSVRVAPAPEGTVNAFLSALIYDVGDEPDSTNPLHNALRGHSLARSMYGSNPTGQPGWLGSTTPWAGVGLFREAAGGVGGYTYQNNTGSIYTSLAGVDRGQIVNQTTLRMDDQFLLVDPEWTRSRFPNTAGGNLPPLKDSLSGRSYVGKHAGYTFPDLKSFFLGARDPYTGEVLVQSFHREWLFGTLAPNNPNWSNDVGRVLTLRPRPGSAAAPEHPHFPRVPSNADGSFTGDVQNCPGSYVFVPGTGGNPGQFVARNDSLWMHIGLPPITLSDGRRIQPLVAPLILPLDGSFDWSTHGNGLNAQVIDAGPPPVISYLHASHGGLGAWEVNINPGIATGTNNEANRQALVTQRKHAPSRSAQFAPFLNGQFANGQQQLLSRYAPVAWNGSQVQLQLPTGNSLLGLPTSGNELFNPKYGNFQNDNALFADHPAAYNRDEFGARNDTTNPASPVYPHTDLKRFSLRYAFTPDWYIQAFATKSAQDTFLGQPGTFPYLANPASNTQSNYRLDPAHTRRLLFTPKASALDRPALAPNFVNRGDGSALMASANSITHLIKPGGLFAGAPTTSYPGPQTRGVVTDFAADNQWYNAMTRLGSVNLNRPLADYRNDLTAPLSATNMGNAAQAESDRQELARDIFARLIVATGAAAQVNPATGAITLPDPLTLLLPGITNAVSADQYNALRYLAQLSVNIVDYIDNDDVSTTFVWNPAGTPNYTNTIEVSNRVVFGVEKPRLLLNEAYSEITNDPADKITGDPDPCDMNKPKKLDPMAKAHVRFWAELVNATSAPHIANTGVLGNGAVQLGAYRIQIARANRTIGGAEDRASFLSSPANTTGRFGDTTGTATVADATFTFQATPTAPTPATVAPNDLPIPPKGGNDQYAPPTNGANTLPAGGFVLVGPASQATPKTGSKEFNPPTTGIWAPANKIDSPSLKDAGATNDGAGYLLTMPTETELSSTEFKRHVVLLRRLSNPYLPVNDPTVTNPAYNSAAPLNAYITVDVMDYVPSFDAVHRAKEGREDRGERPATPDAGKTVDNYYDPVLQRFSVGKVQPLAGLSVATVTAGGGKYNSYNGNTTWAVPTTATPATLTNSMVRDQTATPTLTPGTDQPNEPKNTFGRHNGHTTTLPTDTTVNTTAVPATLTDTVMLPFDWLPHMDRPLETLGDVFTVRDCAPHRLTTEFAQPLVVPPATAAALKFDLSYASWTQHNNGLTRALELLTVKSPALTVPHGGRVGGKLNPNVIQDSRITQGIWDPQSSNRFNQNFVDSVVWDKWMRSRSLLQAKTREDGSLTFNSPVPRVSVLDRNITNATNPGLDRPFLPFGAPTATAGGFAYDSPNANSDGDTFLRLDSTNTPPQPLLQLSTTAQVALTAGESSNATFGAILQQKVIDNTYTRTEPMRKVMNNLTTVSHSFVVYLTIGYFDYEGLQSFPNWPANVPQPPRFGAEVFDQIPGDMRQKFIAVVDMSNMAIDAGTAAPANGQPFFTALTGTARPVANPATTPVILSLASGGGDGTNFSVSADGQTVTFQANGTQKLALGFGTEEQIVTVDAIGPRAAGGNYPSGLTANQIGVTNLTRTAWGGTCVSNVRPGYIGPQPSFNFNSAAYKPVVPYVERLR